MPEETQKDFVRRLLMERGEQGVGAYEFTYAHGITRSAAIVHELRKEEGLPIETVAEQGKQAVYYLRKGPVKVKAPVEGQEALFDERELPPVSWEELGERFKQERRSAPLAGKPKFGGKP